MSPTGNGGFKLRRELPGKFIFTAVLFITDVGIVLLSFYIAYFIRMDILGPLLRVPFRDVPFSFYLKYYYLFFIWPLVFAYEGLYTRRMPLSDETIRLWRGSLISTGIVVISIFALKVYLISRLVILIALVVSFVLFPLIRSGVKALLYRTGIWDRRIIVVGGGRESRLIIRSLNKTRSLGYRVVGVVDESLERGSTLEGAPVIGDFGSIPEILRRSKVDGVLIANPDIDKEKLSEILALTERYTQDVFVLPDFLGLRTQGLEVENLNSLVILKFKNNLFNPWNRALKRTLDVLFSVIALLILAPFMGLVALLIKLDSKGPVFFVHDRIGKGGVPFRCFKFRTMYLDAGERLRRFLDETPRAREEWENFMKLRSFPDPRLTGIGGFLRKYSIDELPQLFNVLKGDMSLVGPRPYLPREIEHMGSSYDLVIAARPGLTGLWQVSGRNELSFKDRLLLDEYYVRNWSLWLDVTILLKTLGSVLKKEGAY